MTQTMQTPAAAGVAHIDVALTGSLVRDLLGSTVDALTRSAEVANAVGRVLQDAEDRTGQSMERVAASMGEICTVVRTQNEQLATLNERLHAVVVKMETMQDAAAQATAAAERRAERRAELLHKILGKDPLGTLFRLAVAAGGGAGAYRMLLDTGTGG